VLAPDGQEATTAPLKESVARLAPNVLPSEELVSV
jgi:hypothetical protein